MFVTRIIQILILTKSRTLNFSNYDSIEQKDANTDGENGAQTLQEIRKNWEMRLWERGDHKVEESQKFFLSTEFNPDRVKSLSFLFLSER